MARTTLLTKLVIGTAVLTAVGFLFMTTLRDVAAEPYTVRRDQLSGWRVEFAKSRDPDAPLLVLRPLITLPMSLFDQVFQRTMESFSTPAEPGIALVLKREFEGALAGTIAREDLAAIARDAGLENATAEPICVAVYRESGSTAPRQLFLLLFDFPAFDRFRAEIARLLDTRGGNAAMFDPLALSPTLLVASSDRVLHRHLSLQLNPENLCVAPVELE